MEEIVNPKGNDSLPDFSGKVVWFEIAGSADPQGGVFLEYVSFRKYGDRLFAVGRMAEIIPGWLAGVEAGVAWDSVIHYMEFASREDYLKRAATHKAPQRGFFRRQDS